MSEKISYKKNKMALDQIDVDKDFPADVQGPEMSFMDHLEELRWRIVKSLGVVVVLGIGLFLIKDWLFDTVLLGPFDKDFFSYRMFCAFSDAIGISGALCFEPPALDIQAIGFAEPFVTSIKVAFISGFFLAFPFVFYQFWKFISPGLYDKERKATRGIVFICSFLFFLGVLFGYFIIAPFAINFLGNFVLPKVNNIPTLSSVISYMVMFTAPAGMIFELPIVIYFLSKIGLVTPDVMRKYRKHSIIGVLLLAAIITPPDVITQFLIGIPLYILYEISIFISGRVEKQREKEMA
jgi:sec-independent protein translocase protein TatC